MMNNPTIVYIHGFASAGSGDKARFLQTHFLGSHVKVISPDLPPDPAKAIAILEGIVEAVPQDGRIVVIGTSLGGFYSPYLSGVYGIPVFAINPLVDVAPIARHIGTNTNLSTGEQFEFTMRHVDEPYQPTEQGSPTCKRTDQDRCAGRSAHCPDAEEQRGIQRCPTFVVAHR